METGTPSITRVITMALFALSCAGLLLFLWLSFGGTSPFSAQGYRIEASFPGADQLGTQADVRISGVTVGKVVAKSLDPRGDRTVATMEIQRKFAPIHTDARAILRQKTIIGETYVEITPGTKGTPNVHDGGQLARGQIQPAVQLDQVFNTFDPTTRRAFQIWQQELAKSLAGNAQNLNSVLGNLPRFAADASDILQVLNTQHGAVVNLVRNGGTVFAALNQNQAALRNLITSGETVFATTAANNAALSATFRVFPTFLTESRLTFIRLKQFALNTDPLIHELIPVAQQLVPTLQSVNALAPDLRNLFTNLGPLITVSQTGLPAIRDVINGAKPLLAATGPFLEELNPIIDWLSLHQNLISDFISQGASGIAGKVDVGSYGSAGGLTCNGAPCGHYLRQFSPVNLGSTGFVPKRSPNVGGNTYPPPLWLGDPKAASAGGSFPGSFALPSWDCNNTGGPHAATATVGACWVAPPLPGAQPGKIPHISKASYSSK